MRYSRITNLAGIVLMAVASVRFAAGQQPGPGAPASSAAATPSHIYVVAFQAVPPFQPQSPGELLNAFNQNLPNTVKTHHFTTRQLEGILFGYICVNGEPGKQALEAMLSSRKDLALSRVQPATPEILNIVYGNPNLLTPKPGEPPRILCSVPANGEDNVDPATSEVTVTFDRDMGGGMSWTGGPPEMPDVPPGARAQWRDSRTCVLPVQLQSGRRYRVGINAPSFKNFRSTEGIPAEPMAILFTTGGAPGGGQASAVPEAPQIVDVQPPDKATGVDPGLKEIRVTFDRPMAPGFSWCGGGPEFPTIPDGQRPRWTDDRMTCVLPVQLKPSWTYKLGINCPAATNFRSADGVAAEPFFYSFTTGPR